ncbi:hypothetical protein [Chimaeribacter californicus]|uniref:hypothetical protein n=1 Tax=Chimaeribacter californicus TaxID=2060067 RepID=UPI0011AF54D5|nr:hypothetical protein [Chimaeribacter californicus]
MVTLNLSHLKASIAGRKIMITLLSEINLSEYDQWQINLMKEMLISFDIGEISLKKLIDNLEGLFFCLQSVDEEWRDEFHEYWFVLEKIYAVSLFRNESVLCDDSDLCDSLRHLNELLTKYWNSHPKLRGCRIIQRS